MSVDSRIEMTVQERERPCPRVPSLLGEGLIHQVIIQIKGFHADTG